MRKPDIEFTQDIRNFIAHFPDMSDPAPAFADIILKRTPEDKRVAFAKHTANHGGLTWTVQAWFEDR